MKKTTYLLAIFIAFQTLTFAQYTAIPDMNFEQALITFGYDSEGGVPDGQILTADAVAATGTLSFAGQGITDLTGIDAFINIDGLNVSYNPGITTLDLTGNTGLINVNLEEVNGLVSLLLTDLSNLTDLNVFGTDLSMLDLTTNISLVSLNARNSSITTLDLSQNTLLTSIDVKGNQLIFLDLRTGTNSGSVSLNSDSNPNLTCIFVDDATAAAGYGWSIDAGSTFVETEVECATLRVDSVKANIFSVYPNPASQLVTVSSKSQNATVEIYNVTGRRILSKTLSFGDNRINVSSLKSGVYLARFISDDRTETKKLIIK